jgi:hypothetical protein
MWEIGCKRSVISTGVLFDTGFEASHQAHRFGDFGKARPANVASASAGPRAVDPFYAVRTQKITL